MALPSSDGTVQAYWKNSMVGRDYLKFTNKYPAFFMHVGREMEAEGKSKVEFDSFAKTHSGALGPLREIIHISTKVALLQQEELGKLEASCLEFKLAFNASYPGSYPVKAHVVSDHL